jgi:hypothetical protein
MVKLNKNANTLEMFGFILVNERSRWRSLRFALITTQPTPKKFVRQSGVRL